MRYGWIPFLLAIASCTASLTEEQRKKLRENMADGEIRKVSDAELTEASFAYGRSIISILESRDRALVNTPLIDSLEKTYHVQIVALVPGDSMALEIENQIIEAYLSGTGQVEMNDDIQKFGN